MVVAADSGGLGQRIGQEVRIQVEELLVQQVDDDALNRCRRQLADQGLGQQQRCHQVGHQVLLQALGRERADVVVFKARGAVDQPGDGAQRIRQAGHQRLALAGIVQVGLEHHGPAAQSLNVRHSLFGLGHGIAAMHADVPAILRQGQGNGTAQPLARPGDEGDAWRGR